MARKVNWARRPPVVPLPGQEPYSCNLCKQRVRPGDIIRWSYKKRQAAHDKCARAAIVEDEKPPDPSLKRYPLLGAMDLERWAPAEDERMHRAFLLWTMQHPTKRRKRAVARAVGVSESVIRNWALRFHWQSRTQESRVDAAAVLVYRQHYVQDFGATELPEVADYVMVPMAAPEFKVPVSEVEKDLQAADRLVRDEILRKRTAEKGTREKHVKIIDAGLHYCVQEMAAGRIRATLKDMPILLQARALLSGEVSEGGATAVLAVDTVRIRLARAAGMDLIDAIAEDLEELNAIVSVLQARKVAAPPLEGLAGASGSHLSVVED